MGRFCKTIDVNVNKMNFICFIKLKYYWFCLKRTLSFAVAHLVFLEDITLYRNIFIIKSMKFRVYEISKKVKSMKF